MPDSAEPHITRILVAGRQIGMIGTPALLINHRVKSVGRVPSRNQIWEWIKEEVTRG